MNHIVNFLCTLYKVKSYRLTFRRSEDSRKKIEVSLTIYFIIFVTSKIVEIIDILGLASTLLVFVTIIFCTITIDIILLECIQ